MIPLPSAAELAACEPFGLLTWGRDVIARATSLDDLRRLRAHLDDLRTYQRSIGAVREDLTAAVELQLRTDRRMGQLLAQMARHATGRPPSPNEADPRPPRPTLHTLGIDTKAASRMQQLGDLPRDLFEAVLRLHRIHNVPATTHGVLRQAAQLAAKLEGKPPCGT